MKIEIFGADWCSPCKLTKKLCEDKGLDYEFNDISAEPEALAKVKGYLGKEPKTIPQVFVDGNHIGGYNEFSQYLENK